MKTITYNPSKDELIIRFCSVSKKPTKEIGRFKLWWDAEGNICAIDIGSFTEELKEFNKKRGWIQLSGIWKGVKIDDEDIKEARNELLKKLEENW
jgi:hypothetical protein